MINKILLDLDGVIVDFNDGIFKKHKKPQPSKEKQWPRYIDTMLAPTPEEFWAPVDFKFWRDLKPLPHFGQLIHLLENRFGEENICLLTATPRHLDTLGSKKIGEAAKGKIAWIEKHLPTYTRRFLIGPSKQFCANSNHCLIDDSESNEEEFIKAGGNFFLFPSQCNRKFKENPIEALDNWLKKVN